MPSLTLPVLQSPYDILSNDTVWFQSFFVGATSTINKGWPGGTIFTYKVVITSVVDGRPEKVSISKEGSVPIEVTLQTGGASTKVRVLGMDRKVTKVGRKSMITYKGKLLSLTEARALEKKLAAEKKKKESGKNDKKSSKKTTAKKVPSKSKK